jgi:hypothetical protein
MSVHDEIYGHIEIPHNMAVCQLDVAEEKLDKGNVEQAGAWAQIAQGNALLSIAASLKLLNEQLASLTDHKNGAVRVHEVQRDR